jgi:hypothetical protein
MVSSLGISRPVQGPDSPPRLEKRRANALIFEYFPAKNTLLRPTADWLYCKSIERFLTKQLARKACNPGNLVENQNVENLESPEKSQKTLISDEQSP